MPQYRALKKPVESTSEILINNLSPEMKIAIIEILVDTATDNDKPIKKIDTEYVGYSNNTLNSNAEVKILAITKIIFDEF